MFVSKVNDILVLSLTISFFLRLTLPQMKYLYFPLLIMSVIVTSIYYHKELINKLISFSKEFSLVLLVMVIYCSSFLFSKIHNLDLYKDVLNAVSVLLFFYVLYLNVASRQKFEENYKKIIKYLISSSILISILGFVKLYLQLRGVHLPFLNSKLYPQGSSLTEDYNFYALSSLLCIIFLSEKLVLTRTKSKSLTIQLIFLILSFNIILSTSRRAMLVLLLFVFILILVHIISFFHKSIKLEVVANNTKLFLLSLILIPSILYLGINNIDFKENSKFYDSVGFKEYYFVEYSTKLVYKIKSIFNRQVSYFETYTSLWKKNFNSLNPESGWGSGIYTPLYKLSGKGVENIPSNAVGYKLDSTSVASTWGGNAYSYSQVGEIKIKPSTRYYSFVYCFVSTNFNGDWVNINCEGNLSGETKSFYDMKKKGQWQKLSLSFYGSEGYGSIFIYFSKTGVTNFSSLRGYVIFAYPDFHEYTFDSLDPTTWAISKNFELVFPLKGDNVRILPAKAKGCLLNNNSDYSTWNGNTYSFLCIGDSVLRSDKKLNASVYCYVSTDFNGDWVRLSSEFTKTCQKQAYYDLSRKGEWQKLELDFICNGERVPAYLYFAKNGEADLTNLKGYVIFACPSYSLKIKSDTISELYSEDLSILKLAPASFSSLFNVGMEFFNIDLFKRINYRNYQIRKDSALYYEKYNEFELAGPRIDRWRFGWYIFRKEFDWEQKLLGGGFAFMNRFGTRFNNNSNQLDWPHNPFISVLLYSGVFGLIVYFLLLFKTLKLYLTYRDEYYIFFICFLLTFFFSFFSGSSPFDPPIMGFFILLPFFIHSIHKNDIPSKLEI